MRSRELGEVGCVNRLQGRRIAGMHHQEKKQDAKTYVENFIYTGGAYIFRVYALLFVCVFAAKQLRRLVQEHERKGCGNTANVVGRHTQLFKQVLIIKQKSIMQDYYLPDANFGIEDSESYRANLLASIYLLMQED
jgi:hypothetical protein